MRLRVLVGTSLLLISLSPMVWAEQFRVGPVYTEQPGVVAVVIEVPPGGTLTGADFHLLADGDLIATAQAIKPFRDSGQGLALAVCVDVSATMARGPLEDVKQALLAFFGKVRPQDRLALVSFADAEEIASSFEMTRNELDDAVRNLKVRGKNTRLYQTVYKSLDLFQGEEIPKRRRLLVISDGKDEGSTEDSSSVIAKSKALGIPIDTVGRGRIDEQYVEALRVLSNSTGGYFVHARPDRLALSDALHRIYMDLLETRSVVVYFTYEADQEGGRRQNATIELLRHGQSVWKGAIPGAIPQVASLVEPPDQQGPTDPPLDTRDSEGLQWWWLLMVTLFAVGLVAVVRRQTKSRKLRIKAADKPASQKPEIIQQSVQPPDMQSHLAISLQPPRRTQVGGYHFSIPELGQPTAILLGISGPVQGQQFFVERDIFHIGANPDNDLAITGDEYVSGSHAYLRYEKGGLLIFDMGSTNGTFVNQHEVTAAGFELGLGDRIRVGKSIFQVAIGPS